MNKPAVENLALVRLAQLGVVNCSAAAPCVVNVVVLDSWVPMASHDAAFSAPRTSAAVSADGSTPTASSRSPVQPVTATAISHPSSITRASEFHREDIIAILNTKFS